MVGWARSPRARAGRAVASARAWSRSWRSRRSCTAVASSTRSPAPTRWMPDRACATAPHALDAAARALRRGLAAVRDRRSASGGVCPAREPADAAGGRRRAPEPPTRRVPPQAAARCRHRSPARVVRRLRRARAPQRLLGGRRRGRLQFLRVGGVPTRQRSLRIHGRALGSPLASTPAASERALRLAERAVRETAEHHAHVRLRRCRRPSWGGVAATGRQPGSPLLPSRADRRSTGRSRCQNRLCEPTHRHRLH